MTTQLLRDANGNLLGTIRPYMTDRLALYSREGELRGYYDIRRDRTYTRGGSLLGTGNLLATLLQ